MNNNGEIQKTVSVVEVLSQVETWSKEGESFPLKLRDVFINCPVDAVRLKCIGGLWEAFEAGMLRDWALDTIRGLFRVGDAPMARNLWIAFSDAVSRGVSLATENCHAPCSRKEHEERMRKGLLMCLQGGSAWKAWVMSLQLVDEFWRGELATAVKCACMLSTMVSPEYVADIYSPALHFDTLRESLEHALLRLTRLDYYEENDWHIANRVLALIYRIRETSFIPLIRELVAIHEKVVSDDSLGSWPKFQNRAVLKEVLRCLEEPVAEKS